MNSLLMEKAQLRALPEALKELEECEGHAPDDMVHLVNNEIVTVTLTSVVESRFVTQNGKIFTTKREALHAEYD